MDEVERIDAVVPEPVREACRTLHDAGFEAFAVGGAVRDALLGREAGDWDVTTSALPEQVQELFRKTIPTGIQHGTVTVMLGRGKARTPVEVTTFRGEGAYTDGRRPDQVHFGVPLREDLARRDFVINAMAYDPVERQLVDPFDGRADLAARRVRAVGDPAERFGEDGLRVMRAIRFAAVLEFELDAATEAAIPGALAVLARVSKERIHDELQKMLRAPRPSVGFAIAERTGVLAQILPELGALDDAALARVDAPGEPVVRLAALLLGLAPADEVDALPVAGIPAEDAARTADAALRRLTFSNEDRQRVVHLVRWGRAWRARRWSDADLRRYLGQVGRERTGDLLAVWAAEAAALGRDDARAQRIAALSDRVAGILAGGDPITVGDLAIGGADVMRILGKSPGRYVGQVLAGLLDRVLEDPALNRREQLEQLVPEVHAEIDAG